MTPKDTTFVEITNEEIYAKIEDIQKTMDKVLAHARKTNGRVTRLEQASIGCWLRNHPIKFAIGCVVFVAMCISDFRHPIIDFVARFL